MSKFAPFGGTTYNLNSSISSTQTSITLSSFLEPVTGTPYTMILINSDIAYGTIAPKTTQSEFISFTGITQNADGTALLTGVTRGLAKKYPFTSDSAYKLPHSGQTQFIISDAPQVFNKYVSLEDAETITGLKTFPGGGNASAPVSGTVYSAPTNDLEYSSKKYVDTVAGGIAIDNAIVVSGTAGANLTAGWVIYQKTSDGKWYKVLANDTTTFQQLELGIAQATVSSGGAVNVLIRGIDANQSALVAGTAYYATDTGGLPSATPGTNTVFVGYGTTTATNLLVDFRSIDIPYHNEKLALVGRDGTPSATNKYLTEQTLAPGIMMMFGGASAPTGWVLCDGSAISRTTYAALFAVIASTYGAGDASTTFNVPDMRGRVPAGVGTGAGGGAAGTGLPTGGSALTAVSRGTWKGEETHTQTVGELAAHTHAMHDGSPNNGTQGMSNGTSASTTGQATESTGSSTPFNVIQPVMGVNFIIKT